jgi:hypothetical protein
MKSKLQKLDFIRNTTNVMIAQSDMVPTTNIKLNKAKKRTVQPLPHLSIQENLSNDKSILNITSHSPANDQRSRLSISSYPISTINPEQIPIKDKFQQDFQDDSQINEFSYRKYRTTRSITSSSSRDEPLLAPDTLIIGKLYILNDLYPSVEHENMNGTPLAFLGAEKFLRTRIDWTKVQYPLSSFHIEIIIDLIIARPSFVREIPKVTKFNLYRPLIKTVSG